MTNTSDVSSDPRRVDRVIVQQKQPFPWRTAFFAVTIVAVCFLVYTIATRGLGLGASSTHNVTVKPSPNVVISVRELARLETVSFHMERVVEITDQQTHLFGLVDSKDALLLIAVGDVTAGVDLAKVKDEDVKTDWDKRTVTLRLPFPEVFASALDSTRTRVYNRNTDTLASRNEDLESRARMDAEATMRRGAIEAGLYDKAKTGAERSLRALLHSLGFQAIEITWQNAPPGEV